MLKDQNVVLTNEPIPLLLDDLQGEPIPYFVLGRHFQLQYVGPRPILWRLGGDRFSRTRLLCDAGNVDQLKSIEFRGTPGMTLTLVSSQARSYQERIGPDGRLLVPLKRLFVGNISERVSISIETSDASVPCLDIIGVPIAHHVDISLQKGAHGRLTIGGSVALDRPAEAVYLALRPYRQPWCASERVACDGFARSWDVLIERAPAEYDLSLVALVDGREVQIFDKDGPWNKSVGHQYPSHDELDHALFEALSCGPDEYSNLDDFAYSSGGRRLDRALSRLGRDTLSRSSTICRCIDILSAHDGGIYRLAIGRIFATLGLSATVSDARAMTSLLDKKKSDVTKFAALSGLPIASGPPGLWLTNDHVYREQGVGDPIRSDALAFFLNVAQTMDPDGQASEFIDKVADNPAEDGLLRSYAKLLRLNLTTDVPDELQRLSDELDMPIARHARAEAVNILERSGFDLKAVLQVPSAGSLFARCVSTVWWFAFASRVVVRHSETTSIPRSSVILSKWLYSKALSTFARLALETAEEQCASFQAANVKVRPC